MNYLQKDIKTMFHSKSAGLLLFAFVLAGLLAAGTRPAEGAVEEPPFSLGIVDMEQDAYSALLIDYFEDSDAFAAYVRLYVGEEEEIRARFEGGELDAWLKIPEDFVPRMIAIDHVPVEVNLSLRDPSKAVILQNLLSSYCKYITAVETGCMALYRQMEADGYDGEALEAANVEVSMDLILTALGRSDLFSFEETKGDEAVPLPFYYACSLLGLLPFLFGIWCGASRILEASEGILNRLSVTAGGLTGWFLSKILLYGTLGVLAESLLYLLFLYRLDRSAGIGAFAWTALYGYGCVCGGLILAGRATGKREFLLTAGMAVLVLAVAGAAFLPVEYLPESFARLAEWMPNRFLAARLSAG